MTLKYHTTASQNKVQKYPAARRRDTIAVSAADAFRVVCAFENTAERGCLWQSSAAGKIMLCAPRSFHSMFELMLAEADKWMKKVAKSTRDSMRPWSVAGDMGMGTSPRYQHRRPTTDFKVLFQSNNNVFHLIRK